MWYYGMVNVAFIIAAQRQTAVTMVTADLKKNELQLFDIIPASVDPVLG